MAYDCTVKEITENGQKKFIVEITCKDEKEIIIEREIRYKQDEKGIPIIARSKATGVEIRFESIKQASQMINTGAKSKTIEKHIGECLNGMTKSAYGYTWRYEDESRRRKRRG